ncbi:hypothetical protein [Mucilaginibacter pedocola]|uniref:VanZ-like domain-containing protein n=1 Tax=Mucilaginibacter pedocola TaxID=1792845 RepID=A0A1S9PG29_9SPHI|nr:hypothetical protein [Mucilaginibacter pedocola]OOQ59914.1 hypothetical protein BC343_27540 [Mucilaginibacter pedocola]
MAKLSLKYTANTKGIVIYYAWLMFNIMLISIKKLSIIQQHFHQVFTHTSNFIITAILMSAVSLIWLLQGAPYKFVLWLGMVAIVLNFVVELFIPVLNTPDIIDAVYGTVGVLITLLVMLHFKTVGLQNREQ